MQNIAVNADNLIEIINKIKTSVSGSQNTTQNVGSSINLESREVQSNTRNEPNIQSVPKEIDIGEANTNEMAEEGKEKQDLWK